MRNKRLRIQFCGFGGQGIVLSSIIFGTAAVLKAGLNAVQTQSYGSEARGGECQAEVIVAYNTIYSPLADEKDILICMSQFASNKYLPGLKSSGTFIYDSGLVQPPERRDIIAIDIPATRIASEMGAKQAANMVMLGFLQQSTSIFTETDLSEAIRQSVRPQFFETNIKAAGLGISLAREREVSLEV